MRGTRAGSCRPPPKTEPPPPPPPLPRPPPPPTPAPPPRAQRGVAGPRRRLARKPSALARELLRNFPKGKRRRGGRRRRKKGGGGGGGTCREKPQAWQGR